MKDDVKEANYQEWKAVNPEAAHRAFEQVQAYKKRLEEKKVDQLKVVRHSPQTRKRSTPSTPAKPPNEELSNSVAATNPC